MATKEPSPIIYPLYVETHFLDELMIPISFVT